MPKAQITERQQCCLDHIKAALDSDGTHSDYSRAHGLNVKELYQWKTTLMQRGLLIPAPDDSNFVPVVNDSSSRTIQLPNGARIDIQWHLGTEQLQRIVVSVNQKCGALIEYMK